MADWVAVDWGTSRLRAWAIGAEGDVIAEAASDKGMGALSPEGFEPALLELITPWLGPAPMPVLACGMVGARQGWREAPYARVPCKPVDPAAAIVVPGTDPRLRLTILPGLSQARPADVMRGEETQVAGLLATRPGFDGIVCLPGTHCKWVHVSAGEVVSFQTFMTGELFALLSTGSVLRHGLQGDGWDDAAFAEALADALSRPQALAARLFALRAEALLDDLPPAQARARLSGLLIGIELAAARPYWLGRDIALVGSGRLADAYATALAAQGVPAERHPADTLTLAGLRAARSALEGSPP